MIIQSIFDAIQDDFDPIRDDVNDVFRMILILLMMILMMIMYMYGDVNYIHDIYDDFNDMCISLYKWTTHYTVAFVSFSFVRPLISS